MKRPSIRKSPAIPVLKEAFRIYSGNEMPVYAGYTTLYILMAMVPLLTLLIGVVNLLPDVSLQHVEEALQKLLPSIPQVRGMVHTMITNLNRKAGSLAISVSLLVSLWSASNGVNALQMGLHKISGKTGSFVRDRAAALLYTLLFLLLIPALFIFRVLRGSIEELIVFINHWLNIPDIASKLINFVEYSGLITAGVMVVVILLTYTFLQGQRRKLRFQLPGALFTTILWLVFSRLYEFFIQRFWQASSLYGSFASIFLAAMGGGIRAAAREGDAPGLRPARKSGKRRTLCLRQELHRAARPLLKRGQQAQRHIIGKGQLHRFGMQHLRPRPGQGQHIPGVDLRQEPCLRDHAGVGGINALHVRIDIAGVGLQRGGQRHRRRVRAAPAEACDVPGGAHALKARHHRDAAPAEFPADAARLDDADLPVAVVRIGQNARLPAGERHGGQPEPLHGHDEQGRRLLLPGGDKGVQLPGRGRFVHLPCAARETVGGTAHGRDHHHKLRRLMRFSDKLRHMAQPFRVPERAAAEFLHNQHVHSSKSKSKSGGQTRRCLILFRMGKLGHSHVKSPAILLHWESV